MGKVTATPAAVQAIERLRRRHGAVVFHQSGGCCDGSAAMCLLADELPPCPGDLELGEIGGVPFYVDADQYRRWREPSFVIDVSPGRAGGFSLEEPDGIHFVSRSGGASAPPGPR